jgi:metallo-beta-lactamase class B
MLLNLLAGAGALAQPADLLQAWNQPVAPVRIAANVYYVGPNGVSSFLITTRAGHILIDTGFAQTVPLIQASFERLGFRFADIKLLLSGHAHPDHVAGHAAVQRLTGATVVAMEEVTLRAIHTPGHTPGCTTWTMSVVEDGRSLQLCFVGSFSINEGVRLLGDPEYPDRAQAYQRTFDLLRSLHCDAFLAEHPEAFDLERKAKRVGKGRNPFFDARGYRRAVAEGYNLFQKQLSKELRSESSTERPHGSKGVLP